LLSSVINFDTFKLSLLGFSTRPVSERDDWVFRCITDLFICNAFFIRFLERFMLELSTILECPPNGVRPLIKEQHLAALKGLIFVRESSFTSSPNWMIFLIDTLNQLLPIGRFSGTLQPIK